MILRLVRLLLGAVSVLLAADARALDVRQSVEILPLEHAQVLQRGEVPQTEPVSGRHVLLQQAAGRWLRICLPGIEPGAGGVPPPVLALENLRSLRVHVLHADRVSVHDMLQADPGGAFGRGQLYVPLTPEQWRAGAVWLWLPPEMAHAGTPMAIDLLTVEQAHRRSLQHSRLITAIVAAQGVLSVLAALLWLVVRGRAILLYSLFVAATSLYSLYITGEGFVIEPFARLAPLGPGTWSLPGVVGFICSALFFSDLVNLRLRMPLAHKGIVALASGVCVLVLASLALPPQARQYAIACANVLAALKALFVLAVAVRVAVGGTRHAQIFLAGWIVMCSFVVLRTWELVSGHVPTPWAVYGLPGSILVADLLMVVALADALLDERRALARARQAAEQDALTGVRNRASIESFLLAALAVAQRDALPVSLLYMDLDHFKQINDRHGHAGGDACLRWFAQVAQSELRHGDALGRIGGEEFVAVLRGTAATAARELAERIRSAVARTPVACAQGLVPLSVSIGVASVPPVPASVAGLLAAADQALYRAKALGRDTVAVYA